MEACGAIRPTGWTRLACCDREPSSATWEDGRIHLGGTPSSTFSPCAHCASLFPFAHQLVRRMECHTPSATQRASPRRLACSSSYDRADQAERKQRNRE